MTDNSIELSLGTKLQNNMYYEITAKVIDTMKDSIKLLVNDSKTGEQAELWYKRSTITDYWQELK